MCGIAGLVFLDRDPGLVSRGAELIRKMTGALRHRGPDDEGYLAVDSGTGEATELWGSDSALKRGVDIEDFRGPADLLLGHRRLAVLDPSPAGHQPMAYAGRRYWVVYNGEIFNWLELRGELASLGYDFRTGTDTEVLLAAYDAWGTDCVRRFIGTGPSGCTTWPGDGSFSPGIGWGCASCTGTATSGCLPLPRK